MQDHRFCNWNEYNLKTLTRIYWRASLVPAAAVIPAPEAYIKVVAVETLVVRFYMCISVRCYVQLIGRPTDLVSVGSRTIFHLDEFRVFKAGYAWILSHGMSSKSFCFCFGVTIRGIIRNSRGHLYLIARGEILGPINDKQKRKHLSRMFSLIKNEGQGIEDDQIPS